MLFNGYNSYKIGEGVIYGYADHPDRNTISFSAGSWNTPSVTGEDILLDVCNMKQANIDAGFYGPYVLYIPTQFETRLDQEFKSGSDKTIRQRLMEVNGIEEIKVADKIHGDNVYLPQMSEDVVRVAEGVPLTLVEWGTEGDMLFNFKVLTIDIPQIRSNTNKKCGVSHLA